MSLFKAVTCWYIEVSVPYTWDHAFFVDSVVYLRHGQFVNSSPTPSLAELTA